MTDYHKKEPSMTRMHFEYLVWVLTVKVPEITDKQFTQIEMALIGNELSKTNENFSRLRWLSKFHSIQRNAEHLHPIRYDNHAGI